MSPNPNLPTINEIREYVPHTTSIESLSQSKQGRSVHRPKIQYSVVAVVVIVTAVVVAVVVVVAFVVIAVVGVVFVVVVIGQ